MLPSLDRLTLRQMVAQMIVVRASGYLYDHQIQYPQWEAPLDLLKHLIVEEGIGGVILLGGSAVEVSIRTQQLQSWANVPLLIAADIEEGVGQRFAGATQFPPPMAFQHLPLPQSKLLGAITAQEANEIGINWVLAPVADVNSNPRNPVINVRSFGEDAPAVEQRVRAFIQGAQGFPVLTTAKHFPGHGDTFLDSHLATPTIEGPLTPMALLPFQGAIAEGVDAIMTAHLFFPSVDQKDIASLSQPMITTVLRGQLGFEGLVVTDALTMAGVGDRYSHQVMIEQAVLAGNDLLLMPPDPQAAIAILVRAVESGRISPDRVRQSVERIWRAKTKIGTSPPPSIPHLANPKHQAAVLSIAQESLRVVRRGIPPWETVSNFINMILVDDLAKSQDLWRHNAPAVAIPECFGGKKLILETSALKNLQIFGDEPLLLLQVFSRGNPFQATLHDLNLCQQIQQFLPALQEKLLAVVLYGSPYLMEPLLAFLPDRASFIFSYGIQLPCQATAMDQLFPPSKHALDSKRTE